MRFVSALVIALLLVLGGCSRDPKVVSKKYVENGNKYFEKGKLKEASLLYRQALAKDRLNGDAYYRLALTELRMGRGSEAYRVPASRLRVAERQHGGDDHLRRPLSNGLFGRSEAARTTVGGRDRAFRKPAQERCRSLSVVTGCRAIFRWRMEKSDDALVSFKTANSIKPLQRDVVIALIQVHDLQNNFPEAEKLGRELIAKDPGYRDIYSLMYVSYLRHKRPEDAEAILKEGVKNNPKEAYFAIRLAGHYASLQKRAETEAVLQNMVANPQNYPTGLLNVGDFYFRLGQLDQALKYYDQGAKSNDKEKATYQKRMIEALVQMRKTPEASQLVELILKENPKDSEATAIRAALVLDTGTKEQVDKAIADLQSVLGSMPNNPVLRFNLGRAYLAKRDLEQAKMHFQAAITNRPDYLPARLGLAQLNLLKGDYAGALVAADEILKMAPNRVDARLMRTQAMMSLGNNDQSRKELTELVRLAPKSGDAQFQLGILNLQEKKYKDAEAIFSKLRENSPGDPRGSLFLAETYLAQGRTANAIGLLQSEIGKNPQRDDLRMSLANMAVRSAEYDLAIKELTMLAAKNPKRADLQWGLGEVYRQSGNFKAALESFRKTRELAPNDGMAHLSFALMLESTGQREQAKPVYEQILKLQPDNGVALNNLAFMMAESGNDLDQALTLVQRAKQKMPNDANVADTMGWIYIKKGLSDDAIRIYRELVQKNPTHVTWRLHLARALYQKGDKLQARKELEACAKNRPNRSEEAEIKDLMGKIG